MNVPPRSTGAVTTVVHDVATRALGDCRQAFIVVGLFSAAVNLLMLTGPIYMLQVYDRVLPSQSAPTLVSLSIIVAAAYAIQGGFDWLRQRILCRVGTALDQTLSPRVIAAILGRPLHGRSSAGLQPARDLDNVRGFLCGLGPTALFDLPWIPLYVAVCFLLHPILGWTLVAGAAALIAITLVIEFRTRKPSREASVSGSRKTTMLEAARRNAEIVAALGMERRLGQRLAEAGATQVAAHQSAADTASGLGAIARVIRFMLQSALLGIGAWLVIRGNASAGVIIAGSVIGSRALAPIELAIGQWRPFVAARQAWHRLRVTLAPADETPTVAPFEPRRQLTVTELSVAAPGMRNPIVQNISFCLEAGDALGIVGPLASGKSTLARALVGVWTAVRGELRLDDATLDQWSPEARGSMLGYLPQDIALFEGTIAENIARFDPEMTEAAVLEAARAAGAYEMILHLPKGFDTEIGEAGSILSGGQRQRIALARALYGNPFLVVLDEPNSNLDADGDLALTGAVKGVRARGGIVIVIAHRPSALAGVDLVLLLADGRTRAFGPKEGVLRAALAPQPTAASAAAGREEAPVSAAVAPALAAGNRRG